MKEMVWELKFDKFSITSIEPGRASSLQQGFLVEKKNIIRINMRQQKLVAYRVKSILFDQI